jgi:hypothetical protein
LLGLAFGEPLFGRCTLAFWSVPIAAGVVGDSRIGAVLTARDMAAERRGAAALDRRHHLELAGADMAGIGTAGRDRQACVSAHAAAQLCHASDGALPHV